MKMHGTSAKEYRREFGILIATPLLDPDLQTGRVENMQRMRKDAEFVEKLNQVLAVNSSQRRGTSTSGQMSEAGRRVLSEKIKREPKNPRRRLTRETGNPATKLTPDQANEVARSTGPQRQTAAKYGISQALVSHLRRTVGA